MKQLNQKITLILKKIQSYCTWINFKFSDSYTWQRPAKSKFFNPNPTRKKILIPETRPNFSA